jgi:CO dehydrogenase maturation factor
MCGTHATVRSLIGELVGAATGVTVADMEAGLEHLSRGTPRHMDTIVVVIEPYFKSLETGRKAYELARELGVPRVHVVANKVRTAEDADSIRAFCDRHGLRLLATIPFDEAFLAADREGKAPLDLAPRSPGIDEIGRLAQLLEGPPGGND